VQDITIEQKALSIIERAEAVVITTPETYIKAGETWQTVKAMMKEVDDTFSPIIAKAFSAHKEAVAQRKKYYDPLDQASRKVKGLMSSYDLAQERIRQEEERRLAEIAHKAEEERILAEAIEAEQSGDKLAAEEILKEEVYIPPVVIPKTTPKINGGPVYRTVKKFRIVDESLIPRQYLVPDMVKIGGVVRALGCTVNIPGIEIYEERV